MSKVYIGVGHGGKDPGACGNGLREIDINLTTAMATRELLEKNGVEVRMSRTDNNVPEDASGYINRKCKEANTWGANLVVEIHYNAGGGDGFEVFHYCKGGTSLTLAKNIETSVKAIGQNSRGCKVKLGSDGKDYFGMIRMTDAPAVLVECAFIDNKADIKDFDETAEQRVMGMAIGYGILETLGIKPNTQKTCPTCGKPM